MPRLNWNSEGQRFYETGVDRGVLYIDNEGVAWTGLTSVSESSSGGDPRPYYYDGIKYLNLASAEEFTATISALSSPPEFGPCDGTAPVHNGLFVTQQPRKPFSFSYRNMVGNDVDGAEHSYKIHLVYNALAAPSERQHSTMGDSTDPVGLQWSITTIAPRITGYRPTSHFVVDVRSTPPDILAIIEDVLYGGSDSNARIPSVDDLMGIFSGAITDPNGITYDGGTVGAMPRPTMIIDGGTV